MLPFSEHGSGEIALVMLPFLGGSQREWTETIAVLNKKYRCITADLPGFGDAAQITGYSVAEMADSVIELLASLGLGRYLLVGHSMAGKVSAVVTRRLTDDGATLHPPIGLVLVAPSPPGPEPMSDSKRTHMLESLGSQTGAQREDERSHAEKYIRENSTRPIDAERFEAVVNDVVRMNRDAWTAWLEGGSREDWSSQVGTLSLPTLVLAADDDGALGPDPQRQHTLPYFTGGHLIVMECGHLIPIEAPEELASLISNFIQVF